MKDLNLLMMLKEQIQPVIDDFNNFIAAAIKKNRVYYL